MIGEVHAGVRRARIGDQFSIKEQIRTASGAQCLLNIPQGKSSIRVHVRPESTLVPGEQLLDLRKGSAFFGVQGKEEPITLRIITPTATASVRGTQFLVSGSEGMTELQVESGLVSFRPYFARIENLPHALIENSSLKKTVETIESAARPVSGGQKLHASQQQIDFVMNADPELAAILDQVESILAHQDKQSLENAQEYLQKTLPEERAERMDYLLKARMATLPGPVFLNPSEIELLRSESVLRPESNITESTEEPAAITPEPAVQAPQIPYSPPSEFRDTVLLKDGSRIAGVKARVTADGVIAIDENENEVFYNAESVDQVLPGR